MTDEPDDEPASPPDLAPLRAAIAELEAFAAGRLPPDHYVRWRTGGVSLTEAAGEVIMLPWPSYGPALERVWDALRVAGFDPDARLNYIDWSRQRRAALEEVNAIATMDRDDLAHLLVQFRRSERFCDGYWVGLVEDGELLVAARRALALALAEAAH